MRAFLAALILCIGAVMPARAYWVSDLQGARMHVRHHIAGMRVRNPATGPVVAMPFRGALSAACRIAASLGGPCGCFASEYFFGHSVRELWLANAWLSFPHVEPAPGTAAVWPNRHVAPVIAANGDGTVTVRDSWAVHRVRVAGLVFVDPRGGLPLVRARRRYANA
jgi:hypothetical protein